MALRKLQFKTKIHAPRERVWKTLWEDATYRKWTAVFSEGSYAETDWKEGHPVKFLSAAGDGMNSVIRRMVPNEYMSFEHIGTIRNFEVQPPDDDTKKWSGSHENYRLKESDGITELEVEVEVTDDFGDYMSDVFPKSLEIVRQLSENN
jgi:uncharacterized protein YndB with AHSA1/START domain